MKTLRDFKKLHQSIASNVNFFGADTAIMRQYREMGIKFYQALAEDLGIPYNNALKLGSDTSLGPKSVDELRKIMDWYEQTR